MSRGSGGLLDPLLPGLVADTARARESTATDPKDPSKRKRVRIRNRSRTKKEMKEENDPKRARHLSAGASQPSLSRGTSRPQTSTPTSDVQPLQEMPWLRVPIAGQICITSMAAIALARTEPWLQQCFVPGSLPPRSANGDEPTDFTRQRTVLQGITFEVAFKSLQNWLRGPKCMSVIRLLSTVRIKASAGAHPEYLVNHGYYRVQMSHPNDDIRIVKDWRAPRQPGVVLKAEQRWLRGQPYNPEACLWYWVQQNDGSGAPMPADVHVRASDYQEQCDRVLANPLIEDPFGKLPTLLPMVEDLQCHMLSNPSQPPAAAETAAAIAIRPPSPSDTPETWRTCLRNAASAWLSPCLPPGTPPTKSSHELTASRGSIDSAERGQHMAPADETPRGPNVEPISMPARWKEGDLRRLLRI